MDDTCDKSFGSEGKGVNKRLDGISDLSTKDSSVVKPITVLSCKYIVSDGINSGVSSRLVPLIVMDGMLTLSVKADSGVSEVTSEGSSSAVILDVNIAMSVTG